jgi:nitroreductase
MPHSDTIPDNDTALRVRKTDPRVEKLIVKRWSPRSYDESEIPDEDLAVIFEAAGLAPSAYNYQPWKFLYAKRGDANWDRFLSILIPFNASWVKTASALVFIVSDTQMGEGADAKPSHTHSFDAGAAWANMALQATALGYHAHGMIGLDLDAARSELQVPDRYRIEAAAAIGREDSPEKLPEGLREREVPSTRKPVSEVAIAGNFK